MKSFELKSKFKPTGDQPQVIQKLVDGLRNGEKSQVLLGVTGSGKTFTMANVIEQIGRPALVLAHNKTLAAQLCNEFREFFPNNRVEYFVSYYDYYQPESYLPSSDTYIEKDMSVNDEIDKLRHSATCSLAERRDVIVVASVSCIYGLGAPDEYYRLAVELRVGEEYPFDKLIARLVEIQYQRNDIDFQRGTFRIKGDVLEIIPAYNSEVLIRIDFFGDEVERICEIEQISGKVINNLKQVVIFPASHYAVENEIMQRALTEINADMLKEVEELKLNGKLLESQRLLQRTTYDMEMMKEVGYCNGIENYSRYFDGRKAGMPPYTLLDYFPDDFVLFIDESHMTIPQVRAMYNGDKARKTNLIDYGFRLQSAFDNRPLTFSEFNDRIGQVVYVSATPADYELNLANGEFVEQLIRPTGLLDPIVQVKPSANQIDDLLAEIQDVTKKGSRVLVTTLTKKMAEKLSEYLKEQGIKGKYMHSEIDTLERIDIINELRRGDIEVLVGINLLREGLDLPEVELVAILDADKEGFLRSETSLIQTIGRCARNSNGRVVMYADTITGSMDRAIKETERRREIQSQYNLEHNIVPKTIKKDIVNTLEISSKPTQTEDIAYKDIPAEIEKLKAVMALASANLDFEKAIEIRETIARLKKKIRSKNG